MDNPLSLQTRFIIRLSLVLFIALGVAAWVAINVSFWPFLLPLIGILALLAMIGLVKGFFQPVNSILQALRGGVASFKDHDYSVSIAVQRDDELGQLVSVYNDLAGTLRKERFDLFQRELLLDTVIQSSAVVVIITNINDTVIFSNRVARDFLNSKTKLEGLKLKELVQRLRPELADIFFEPSDGLFTIEHDSETEVYHCTHRRFNLNNQINNLYLLKQMTREIARQEVDTWKKVIRVISHELNNSLAPVSSLSNSARMIVAGEPLSDDLDEIFEAISERVAHLNDFISRYARFARLPKPRLQRVTWKDFIAGLKRLAQFRLEGELPAEPAVFDPLQMEQVLINLLKNAVESGSATDQISLRVLQNPQTVLVAVEDRGNGLNEEQMAQALLPFYSTKRSGTGLGLPLCREIIEAHGGSFRILNREGGGMAAICKLPQIELVEADTD